MLQQHTLPLLTGLFCLITGCSSTSLNVTTKDQDQLPDPLAAGWHGKPVCEQLVLDENQRVLRCTFPPGVGHERHFHRPHVGYALSGGTMQLVDASGVRQATLKTGSHYTSNGTEWHEVLNVGDTTVQYLIIETL